MNINIQPLEVIPGAVFYDISSLYALVFPYPLFCFLRFPDSYQPVHCVQTSKVLIWTSLHPALFCQRSQAFVHQEYPHGIYIHNPPFNQWLDSLPNWLLQYCSAHAQVALISLNNVPEYKCGITANSDMAKKVLPLSDKQKHLDLRKEKKAIMW